MIFVPSLNTKVQPRLPKYLASTSKCMCLGVLSFFILGGLSKKAWKYLSNCLEEILVLVSLSKLLIETPAIIQALKSLKYEVNLPFFLFWIWESFVAVFTLISSIPWPYFSPDYCVFWVTFWTCIFVVFLKDCS